MLLSLCKVCKSWLSWAAWICPKQVLEHWQRPSSISSSYFFKGFCWLDSETLWGGLEDLASQAWIYTVNIHISLLLGFFVTSLSLHGSIIIFSFEFRLRVALSPSGDLMLTSRIRNTNTDGKPFSFTFAYHTYFSVSDIRYVYQCGLYFLLCFSSQDLFPFGFWKIHKLNCR